VFERHGKPLVCLSVFHYFCAMLKDFKAFIEKEKLFVPSEKILLTVSGGIDSVVMTELFYQAGYHYGIAHCNFGLRGKESDADEAFVEQLALKYHLSFYTTRFSTARTAKARGISVQMAARDLRYAWFEKIREKEKYAAIATAHHLDDQIETFFINLIRGSGIAGLHGILPRQGHIIRPMLFTTRENIIAYSSKHKLLYREDSSNAEIKYLRNKIRHEIIPIFRELNPAFSQTITETILRLRDVEKVFTTIVDEIKSKIIKISDNDVCINIDDLHRLSQTELFVFEILSPYGFNESVIRDIMSSSPDSSGKVFYSPTHRLVKNRKELIINVLVSEKEIIRKNEEIVITENQTGILKPIHLSISKLPIEKKFAVDISKEVAMLDLHKIEFPLILRRWRRGDSIHPYGMDKKKKLSDLFIDLKLSIPEKENIWLLCSGSYIIWVLGHRIDHRFRVTAQTKEVLKVRWLKGKND
jgi:tRNA(Ile)-lysidine synthase